MKTLIKRIFPVLLCLLMWGCGKSADEAFKDGLNDLYNKNIQSAKANFELVIKKDPEKVEAYVELVKIYQWLGNEDKVLQCLNKIVEIDPTKVDAQIELAKHYADQNDLIKAKEQIQIGLENSKNNPQLMALLKGYSEKIEKAMKDEEQILKIEELYHNNPEDVSAGIALLSIYRDIFKGMVLAKKNNQTQSVLDKSSEVRKNLIARLEPAATKETRSGKASQQLAEIYFYGGEEQLLMGNVQSAIIYMEKSIDYNPDNGKYYFILAQLYESDKRPREKVIYFTEKAVRLSPDMADYRVALAGFYAADKNLEEARKHLKKALDSGTLSSGKKAFAEKRLQEVEKELASNQK